MSSAGVSAKATSERVADELRSRDKFLLTAHEGPDGDALGSLLGMHHLLTQLGKDSVMFLAAKEFPLPIEYRFLPLEEVFHEPPADMADRTAIFLDCGNIDRMPVDFLSDGAHEIINIDHHHDNTQFGDLNLVDVGASCTAEIVYELALLLGARITPEMASALYVGLVTDTGKFMYDNTNARTHRIAADLIEAGVPSTKRTAASTSTSRSRRSSSSPAPSRASSATVTSASSSPISPPRTTRRQERGRR